MYRRFEFIEAIVRLGAAYGLEKKDRPAGDTARRPPNARRRTSTRLAALPTDARDPDDRRRERLYTEAAGRVLEHKRFWQSCPS